MSATTHLATLAWSHSEPELLWAPAPDAGGLLPPVTQLGHSSFQAAPTHTMVPAGLQLCPGLEMIIVPHVPGFGSTVTRLLCACTIVPGQPLGGWSFSAEKLL